MVVVSIVVILMASILVYTVMKVIKPLQREATTIVIPDEICQESIMWYRNIISMEDGAEKFRELDQFKEHVLSLEKQEKLEGVKVVSLRGYRS